MTIASTTNRNNYVGNGSTATYAYNYKITADTDLLVTVRSILGVETTLTRTTHYTVTGVGNVGGGNIVLVNEAFSWIDGSGFLATAVAMSIRRVRPRKQLTDIRNQGSFYPETHEDALDNLCMIDQQQQDEIDRSFKLPETVDPATFDTTMPATLPDNPGSVVIVNATGDGFDQGPTADQIASAQADADAAEASALSASNSAATATTQAGLAATARTAAETAQGLAQTAKTDAETARDLAQNYANALKATSVSSVAIGTGTKTFTTQSGKQFVAGQFVVIVDQASSANYMVGQVSSYSSTTLVVDSQVVGGSGTKAAWNIAIAGSVGPTGATGATGTAGLNFLSGAGAPSDALGVQNDMYLNTTNWDVYKKGASTWGTTIGNIKGATGDTGATGATGDGKFNTATTTVKTDNYTVQSSDFGNVLVMNSASAKAFTLPNIITASVIILKNIGAGACTITPDASDTVETTTLAQYESAILVADTTNNVWRNIAKSGASGASTVRGTFTDAQLNATAGILSITHNLGLTSPYTVDCEIFNNTPVKVGVDNVQNFSANALDVDLSSYVKASIGTCTMTIASPCVVTRTAHGYSNDQKIMFSTTGALPTGLTAGQMYYVVNKSTDTFQVSLTQGGTAINTSGSQSGVHTLFTYIPITGTWSYAI
jgi:hypothetical protein